MSESNDWQVSGSGSEIYENVFVPAMMGEWAARAMALANLQPSDHVLDVACGTGVLTRLVAKSIGSNGRVVGLDLSSDMLAVARNITLTTPIEWYESNASDMPFEKELFDVVFCEFGLMFFPDRVATLQEMRRVLKPNGQIVLSVWGSISKCPGQTAMRESWEHHFSTDRAGLFYRQHALSDPETVHSLINDAGFRDIAVQRSMGVVRLPTAEDLVRSYGAMAGVETDEKTRAIVINEVSAALQSYVGAEGLEYPIEAILASARK